MMKQQQFRLSILPFNAPEEFVYSIYSSTVVYNSIYYIQHRRSIL
jgi:hypothetical protein